MSMNFTKAWVLSLSFFFTANGFAEDIIEITVTMADKAAAVGYLVEGKRVGGLGKSYSGKGPVHKIYSFGYRKNALTGADIPCGSLTLDKNTKVTLVTQGEQCLVISD